MKGEPKAYVLTVTKKIHRGHVCKAKLFAIFMSIEEHGTCE